ncbi:FAD-dependent oxidoreductase [Sinanaerobacter chloroacetimidivorans]|uniref:FAD-dependent oxidoreductase n=1 Tax=Sinanaerobacter chloroacetimidivorans TaxID=2818044 RepID=A0A8J7W5M8_9FIRM|nr:FAD-dependent oxidoreductase [Sinanaerobacter chloroacetimidivorans]MBR0599788.1 FAD-dependent oxidoreductase [Sinanaerobacter chloroacetimidivorans]
MSNLTLMIQPIKIGGTIIKNRVVMPPMDNFVNMDGSFSRKHYCYLTNRARGGVGLIVMEAASVSWPEGKISERQLRINSGNITPELREMADSVHAFGTKIIVQLHHGGFIAVPEYSGGVQSVAPSEYGGARALTLEEIEKIKQDFETSAKVAQTAGLDGVELHASHMYLLNQFRCPACNQRNDQYGGSLENRFRIVKEIIEEIRKECPAPFILGVRLGIEDLIPGGTTLEEGMQYAKWCEEAGADMLNITTGFFSSVNNVTETQWQEEGARVYMGEAAKKAVKIPVAIVGKLRTPEFCAKIIEEGKTDMVVIGRQLICDLEWPNRVLFNRTDEIRPCLNCDEGCLGQYSFQHGTLHCSMNPYVGYEDLYCENSVLKTGTPKNIVIAGGGIAAMQFTIIAQKRGHSVTILEKADKLGGQLILAAVPPYKREVGKGLEWFKKTVSDSGAIIKLNMEATAESIAALNPDIAIVAVGSLPNRPPVQGIDNAIDSWDILEDADSAPENKKVEILGGGVVGSEVAHLLIEKGCDVNIIEMLPEICHGHEAIHKALLEGFLSANATLNLNATITEVGKNYVKFIDNEGRAQNLNADVAICATGQRPSGDILYDELLAVGIEAYKIGDAVKAANIRCATRAALDLAYTV